MVRTILRRSAVAGLAVASVAAVLVGAGSAPAAAAGGSADLSVSVAHTPNVAQALQSVTFTVTATNDGPDAAAGVVAGLSIPYPLMPDVLPDECDAVSYSESVLCDLGDLAAGSSASVEMTVVPRGSGLYNLPVAVASETDDPDTDDLATTLTMLVKAAPPQSERYVRGIFPIILDRPVDPGGLAYWSQRWVDATRYYPQDPASVPAAILATTEYRRLRIDQAYQAVLGRPADPGGLATWVAASRRGWSYARIERALLTSGEFAASHGADWLEAALTTVFGRSPTSDEVTLWSRARAGGASRGQVVASAQRSTPGFDAVIARLWHDTLGTGPDPLGRYVWQYRLRQGMAPEQLWAQLLVGNEVLSQYPYTQDDYDTYGEPVYDAADQLPALQAALGS